MQYKFGDELSYERLGEDGDFRISYRDTEWVIPANDAESVMVELIGGAVLDDLYDRLSDETCDQIREMHELGALVPVEIELPSDREMAIATMDNSDCSQLFVMFQGRAIMELGEKPDVTRMFDLLGLLDRNLVSVRDVGQTNYRRGVSKDLPTLSDLFSWLRGYMDAKRKIEHTHFAGVSMGAFPAIMGGHYLGVDTVSVFGLIKTTDAQAEEQDGPLEWNLRELLSDHNGVTEYHLYFGEEHERDAEAAAAMEDLPGVHLHGYPADTHQIAQYMAENDMLDSVFPPFEAVEGASQGSDRKHDPETDVPLPTPGEIADIIEDVPGTDYREAIEADSDLSGVLESFSFVRLVARIKNKYDLDYLDPAAVSNEGFSTPEELASVIEKLVVEKAPN